MAVGLLSSSLLLVARMPDSCRQPQAQVSVSTTTSILPVNSANQVTQFGLFLEATVSNPATSAPEGPSHFYDNGTLISLVAGTSASGCRINGIAVCSSKAKDAR